jgi:large subunit ribosomal protein L29
MATKAKDLQTKSAEELNKLLVEKRADLLEKRRALKAGELTNPSSIKQIRREIAAVLTLLNQQPSATKEEKK